MRIIAATTAIALAIFPALVLAETAQEIVQKHEQQKIADLEAYLEANPDADDTEAAISALVEAAAVVEDSEKFLGYLEKKYEVMEKGAGADLEALIGGVVQPLLGAYVSGGDADKAKGFIATVKKDLADHQMAPQINQFLDQLAGQLDQPQVGGTMEIAFTSTEGEEIDLAAMEGKVVLVDFWATWCGPCVAEMPNVIAAYEKYHEQGFEVIGISLDQDKEALDRFTADKGMDWPQYFDGKGWQNDIASKFGISGIPATYLIGKDGKIIATDLRGGALEAQLEELLGEG